jgi:hypothetical protein
MFLEIPLRMSGQPGIYKLEKQIFVGVRDLLKKQPVTWWPPQEYKLFTLGRFDLYPIEAANMSREAITKNLGKVSEQALEVKKTNVGCFHLKHLFSIKDQQVVLDATRTLCIEHPQRVTNPPL